MHNYFSFIWLTSSIFAYFFLITYSLYQCHPDFGSCGLPLDSNWNKWTSKRYSSSPSSHTLSTKFPLHVVLSTAWAYPRWRMNFGNRLMQHKTKHIFVFYTKSRIKKSMSFWKTVLIWIREGNNIGYLVIFLIINNHERIS